MKVCAVILCALAAAAASDPAADITRLLDRSDFSAAVDAAREFVKSNPRSPQAHVLAARAMIGAGKPGPALAELRAALALAPDDVDALYYTFKLGGVLGARELDQLYRLAPDSSRVHQLLAEGAQARGDKQTERREWEKALGKDPHSIAAMIGIGDLSRHDDRYAEAIVWYARALKENAHSYDALYGTGACKLFLDQPGEAVPFFRDAVAAAPDSEAAAFALGDALLRAGHPQQAIAALNTAVKVNPSMRQAYALLVRAYQKAGRREDAAAAMRKFRELANAEVDGAILTRTEKP